MGHLKSGKIDMLISPWGVTYERYKVIKSNSEQQRQHFNYVSLQHLDFSYPLDYDGIYIYGRRQENKVTENVFFQVTYLV